MSRYTRMVLVLALAVVAGTVYSALPMQPVMEAAQAQAPPVRPALLFREEWKQEPSALGKPTSSHANPNNQYHLAGQSAVTNPNLELHLYGFKANDVTVYAHEGRIDLWTGLVGAPVALTLKHRNSYLDLTGLARVRATVRTNNLHVLHPVVKLADGRLLAGSQTIGTNGAFLTTEVAFDNQRWFTLDPEEVATSSEITEDIDFSRIDEVGFVDLAPGGGHGNSGWVNVSTVEVFAKAVPR